MKVLMIFCDMLGGDYINFINNKYKKSDFEYLLEKIGGTLYTNCYTPAPDTPRSSACAWTGLYPKANGCDNRLKYPGRFLKTDNTFWKALVDNDYQVNAYVKSSMNRIGLLPDPFDKKVQYNSFIDSLENFKLNDNSFTFFYFPDLHLIMDVNGYNINQLYKGKNILAGNISKVFNKFSIDKFDYIIIFSDHGFRIKEQSHLIEDDRVKTLMFVHKKGDENIVLDNSLHSNIDIMPTVLQMIKQNIPQDIDGISLLSGNEHSYVLVEDHQDFSVKLGQTIEHWAVIDHCGKHWLECNGKWEHDNNKYIDSFNEKLYLDLIITKMNDYLKNNNLYEILHRYDNYKSDNNYLTDGTKIKKNILNCNFIKFIKRVLRIINKNLFSI